MIATNFAGVPSGPVALVQQVNSDMRRLRRYQNGQVYF